MRHRKWVRTACVALLAYGLLRFFYGGVLTPAARSITGDFYSAFPAPFTEAYNPVLLKDNIFGVTHVSLQGYWSYGPGFHVITLPLTLLSSYGLIDWLVLLALWCLDCLPVDTGDSQPEIFVPAFRLSVCWQPVGE